MIEGVATARQMCGRLEVQLAAASRALEVDPGASPVLAAVVAEFERKFKKTRPAIADDVGPLREAVVELEQAADSARYAALADSGASEATRDAVFLAHDTICVYKASSEMPSRSG